MITFTYMELLGEHDLIDELLKTIQNMAGDPFRDSSMIAVLVDDLAIHVRNHIDKESCFISGLGQDRLVGEWIVQWKQGLADFDALCIDWQAFLDRWTPDRIARDRGGFTIAAQDVLGRLRRRVQEETAILYSAALQTGAIRLR